MNKVDQRDKMLIIAEQCSKKSRLINVCTIRKVIFVCADKMCRHIPIGISAYNICTRISIRKAIFDNDFYCSGSFDNAYNTQFNKHTMRILFS